MFGLHSGKTRLPLEVYQLLLTEPTVHPSYVILCMSILKELNQVPNFEELPSPDDINPIMFSLWSESGFSKLKVGRHFLIRNQTLHFVTDVIGEDVMNDITPFSYR